MPNFKSRFLSRSPSPTKRPTEQAQPDVQGLTAQYALLSTSDASEHTETNEETPKESADLALPTQNRPPPATVASLAFELLGEIFATACTESHALERPSRSARRCRNAVMGVCLVWREVALSTRESPETERIRVPNIVWPTPELLAFELEHSKDHSLNLHVVPSQNPPKKLVDYLKPIVSYLLPSRNPKKLLSDQQKTLLDYLKPVMERCETLLVEDPLGGWIYDLIGDHHHLKRFPRLSSLVWRSGADPTWAVDLSQAPRLQHAMLFTTVFIHGISTSRLTTLHIDTLRAGINTLRSIYVLSQCKMLEQLLWGVCSADAESIVGIPVPELTFPHLKSLAFTYPTDPRRPSSYTTSTQLLQSLKAPRVELLKLVCFPTLPLPTQFPLLRTLIIMGEYRTDSITLPPYYDDIFINELRPFSTLTHLVLPKRYPLQKATFEHMTYRDVDTGECEIFPRLVWLGACVQDEPSAVLAARVLLMTRNEGIEEGENMPFVLSVGNHHRDPSSDFIYLQQDHPHSVTKTWYRSPFDHRPTL